MPDTIYAPKGDLAHCKCGLCDHESKESCINGRCDCCDLEDAFSLLTQEEFEPRVTKQSRKLTAMAA